MHCGRTILNYAGQPEQAIEVSGAGATPQPASASLVLIPLRPGLSLDRAGGGGDYHPEESPDPRP